MKVQSFPYAFFQDEFVKIEDAKVSIMTNALQYGTAIFGGIRAYYSAKDKAAYVFRLDDHYKRFLASAGILGCPLPYSLDQLKSTTIELITKNQPTTDAYLRPYAYVGNTQLGPNLANTTLDFALYMIELSEYLPVSKGLGLTVSSWRRIADTAIPSRAKASGAYINSALARKEATDGGFDEAILLRENGQVSEGSAENIFLVRDGILVTPSVSEGILEGITRRSIVKIAQDMGIPVETRPVEKSELYVADEVFLSGTGCQVAWVSSIDKRPIGSGSIGHITKKLQDKFFGIVRGTDLAYASWLTKIDLK
jgi:branched-chain amino acid aminotransferase